MSMIGTPTQRRIAASFLDQCVSSMSNFATGVVVARLSGAAEFGQYMLVMVIWVLAVGLHRALLTEPLIVMTRETDDSRTVISHGLSAELLLACVVAVFVAVGGLTAVLVGASVGGLILASSPWFVPLLLQDYWRGMAFQQRRPSLALINDLIFVAVQALMMVVVWLIGWRSAGYFVAAWGTGATAGAVVGLWWFRSVSSLSAGAKLLLRLWPLSRWMVADFVTAFASTQAYLFFAVLLLSDVAYGGFRAAFSLMGPTIVVLHAGANIGLPEAARRTNPDDLTDLRRFARQLSAVTAVVIGAYGTFVSVGGRQLLIAIYGLEFAPYAPLVTLGALQYILAVSVFGHTIALKAAGRMRLLWRVRLLAAGASLTSMVVLIWWLGTIGAGWAAVATGLYYVCAVYAVYSIELRGGRANDAAGPSVRDSLFPVSGEDS